MDKETGWTFTNISISSEEIARQGYASLLLAAKSNEDEIMITVCMANHFPHMPDHFQYHE